MYHLRNYNILLEYDNNDACNLFSTCITCTEHVYQLG